MAGINNNLGNLNLAKTRLNTTVKKPEVKEDEKEIKQQTQANLAQVSDKVVIGDIKSDAFLANKGIKINKLVYPDENRKEVCSHYKNRGDFEKAIKDGRAKIGDTFDEGPVRWRVHRIDANGCYGADGKLL